MEHSLVPSAHSDCVHLMQRQLSYVIQLNEIWISQHVILVLDVVLLRRPKSSTDWRSVTKGDWLTELSSCFCILIELCHFYNLNLYTKQVLKS